MSAERPLGILDCDDVIYDTGGVIIDWTNDKFGLDITRETFHDDFFTLWNVSKEEGLRHWATICRDVIPQAPLIEGAAEGIGELAELLRLQVLTSRAEQLLPLTRLVLRRDVGEAISEVHGATIDWNSDAAHKLTKGEDLSRLRPVFYFEDQPRHCNSGIEAGVPIVGLHDRPHNRQGLLDPKVVRLTWPEVVPFVRSRLEVIAA